ncbi:hypothetical protein DOTSEDRAFT_78213 [Dothistroma septosporum NZE10]|uniref:Uncharacterized protein n=1 Tax=Dothistroma septosporum (strain NZE10 / CBS 128990) TaxID=675120 RepID=N1PXJ0_DOTSN|nr:hypothetical protein DOTSEDRAFT_78213 [Dothistroma septosporum NZE10]
MSQTVMSPQSQTSTMTTRQRRTSGKPGRFDPSEPLHMTTRGAAKNRPSNGSGSIDGSIDESESRRCSLDDLRPTTSHSLGSQTPAGSRRVSGTSTHDASEINVCFDPHSSTGKNFERFRSNPYSPTHPAASPSRKRKRTTPTPPGTPDGSGDATVPPEVEMTDRHPMDFVELLPMDQLSSRAGSDDDSPSDDDLPEDYGGIAQSTELTPAATSLGSQPVSPISETSMHDVVFSPKVVEPVNVKVMKPSIVDEAEEVEDAEDLAEADEIEEGDDVDEDHIRLGPRRRVAGRRRADHPDARVEATMRRQLQLKSAFRAITRSLKPILAEIALKTTEELDANPHLHEQVAEYQGTEDHDGVQKQLDDILARRKAQIEAQYKWNKQNLRQTLGAEEHARTASTEQTINDLRELHLDRLDYDILKIAREAQMSTRNLGYETDDEDGHVIRARQGMQYKFTRTGPLDSKYESGSRMAIEGGRAVQDLQARFEMFQALRDHHRADQQAQATDGFTVMDMAARRAANARKKSVLTTQILAAAATEQQRIDNLPIIPVIPNEQAHDLQLLAKLATRPAIQPFPRSIWFNKSPQHSLADPFQTHRMGPPQTPLRPAISFDRPQPQTSPRSAISYDIAEPTSNRPSESPRQKAEPSRGDLAFLLSPPAGTYRREEPTPPVKPAEPVPSQHGSVPPSPIARPFQLSAEAIQRTPGKMAREESSQLNTHKRGDSSSEQYHRPMTVDCTPGFAQPAERPMHQFSSGSLSIARVDTTETSDRNAPDAQPKEQKREGLTPHPSLPPKPPAPLREPFDPHSGPGAPDSRFSQERAEVFSPQKASIDGLLQKPRSRASSEVSQSATNEATTESSTPGDSERGQPRHKAKATHKTSKTDRNGLSRKAFKQHAERRRSHAEPPEGKPRIMRFRLSGPPEVPSPARPPQFTSTPAAAPPQLPNHDHYQPHVYGSYPGFPGQPTLPPPRQPPYPYQNGYESSWPHPRSLQGPLPPAPGYQPSPSHPYGMPGGLPPMLPTVVPGGVMEWPPLFGPPPYGHASQPPTPHQGPHPGPPGQFGGPTIAPASDHRSSYGAGPSTNIPAFAQQKRQDDGSSRRRTQSDYSKRDFKHYDPITRTQKPR